MPQDRDRESEGEREMAATGEGIQLSDSLERRRGVCLHVYD